MPERLDKDHYFLGVAKLIAQRGTCSRRKVGAVAVNAHSHIMATGYAGVPRGVQHCTDERCPGANYTSGHGLDKCMSVHAEQNMLLQCSDVMAIDTVYVTCSPCSHCFKMLLNTGTERIVFDEPYPGWMELAPLWEAVGKTWEIVK